MLSCNTGQGRAWVVTHVCLVGGGGEGLTGAGALRGAAGRALGIAELLCQGVLAAAGCGGAGPAGAAAAGARVNEKLPQSKRQRLCQVLLLGVGREEGVGKEVLT